MDSVVSRIMKARQYALERDRISLENFRVTFRGEHNTYRIAYDSGTWNCTCEDFIRRGVCSHVMALERLMGDWVAPAQLPDIGNHDLQTAVAQ